MSSSDVARMLTEGDLVLQGHLPWSSNYTFLVEAHLDDESILAVYKPVRGERPLWDFPPGLYRREQAAYVLSETLGWHLVPETVIRDGPLGMGSVQRFVAARFEEHYFTLLERPEHADALRTICAFDLIVNNADRKSGHCLLDTDGRIWAIDHGLCFHREPKLRTVMWDFVGEPLPEPLVTDIARFALTIPAELAALLDDSECHALVTRAVELAQRPLFPDAPSAHAYPWPMV